VLPPNVLWVAAEALSGQAAPTRNKRAKRRRRRFKEGSTGITTGSNYPPEWSKAQASTFLTAGVYNLCV